MDFSVTVLGSDDFAMFKTHEKLVGGLVISINLQSVSSISDLSTIENTVENHVGEIIGTSFRKNEFVMECALEELKSVESIWDIAKEWRFNSELFNEVLEQKGIKCQWELKIYVSVTSDPLDQY